MAGGGTFVTQNKVRPGVYIKFTSKNTAGLTVGERGTVAICQGMSWGVTDKIMEVEGGSNLVPFTGYDSTNPKNRFLNELFKGSNRTNAPTKVLLYRPNPSEAARASATLDALTVTAKYVGERGNDISIAITELVDQEGSFTVTTLVDGDTMDTQTAKTVSELTENDWVTFSGDGALTANTGKALTGGLDGTVDTGDYAAFLTALEPYKFDVLIYDGAEPTVQDAMIAFIKRLAEENGRYAQLVLAEAVNPDSRFVVNVVSGVTLSDGTVLSPQETTWWVGGAMAGATFNQSLTGAVYPNAVAVEPVLTDSQICDKLTQGALVLTCEQGVVRVEQDCNSLVTYTADIGKVYRKNRVIRLCSTIANDLYSQFVQNYVGIVNNDQQGRNQLKAAIVGYLLTIQSSHGIQNLEADDVTVLAGDDIDAVVVNLAIQAVDSMEKIYVTMELS